MAASFNILSVDGGGIRGIIPALILAAIEDQTQRRISDLFGLIAGTSTGGIIALGLTKPGPDGTPEKSARDLVNLYEQEGHAIFPSSLLQGLHLNAIRGPKYNGRGLDEALKKHFGEARLKDAVKPVLVPSYDIEKQRPIFFKSERARQSADSDFPMVEVARATSSAPTYFPPEKIDTTDPLNYYALIDGGVVAGNPAMCAYAEAIKMGQAGDGGLFMLSLGTGEQRHPLKYSEAVNWGQLEWAQPVIDIVLQGSNMTVDYQLQQLLQPDAQQRGYFRFQLELTQDSSAMDDTSEFNLKRLIDLTQDFLTHPDTKDRFARVCAQLTS